MSIAPSTSLALSALLGVLSLPLAQARADSVLAGYGEYGSAATRIDGPLGAEIDGGLLGFHLGGGLRWGRYALGPTFDMSFLSGRDIETHGTNLLWLGLGPDFRIYGGGETGFRPYARLGLRKAWLNGSQTVRRTCSQTGTCAGGFWNEEPSYSAKSAVVSVGFEFLIPPVAQKGGIIAFHLDLAVERAYADILGNSTPGTITRLSFGIAFGGGRVVSSRRTTTRAPAQATPSGLEGLAPNEGSRP